MQFHALILSLAILFSLFITHGSDKIKDERERETAAIQGASGSARLTTSKSLAVGRAEPSAVSRAEPSFTDALRSRLPERWREFKEDALVLTAVFEEEYGAFLRQSAVASLDVPQWINSQTAGLGANFELAKNFLKNQIDASALLSINPERGRGIEITSRREAGMGREMGGDTRSFNALPPGTGTIDELKKGFLKIVSREKEKIENAKPSDKLKKAESGQAESIQSKPLTLGRAEPPAVSRAEPELKPTGLSSFLQPSGLCASSENFIFGAQAGLAKYFPANITVFEKNSERRWPIASLTKLMTAVTALEKIESDQRIVMTDKTVGVGGTIGNFQAGEIYTAGDLIKAMLVGSSNDGALAIAHNFGEKNFVDEMQRRANNLGMQNTTYLEPTGLSFVNQSTPADLTKLANYIYEKHPEIFEISRQKQVEIIELKSGAKKLIPNIDDFAGEPDFLGGKTGHTDEAGRNLTALFRVQNGILLTVVLGAEDAVAETKKLKEMALNCR